MMPQPKTREEGAPAPGADRAPLAADNGSADEQDTPGDTACWAHLVCPACGAMLSEGHRADCRLGWLPGMSA
jgi:hypothetical protein